MTFAKKLVEGLLPPPLAHAWDRLTPKQRERTVEAWQKILDAETDRLAVRHAEVIEDLELVRARRADAVRIIEEKRSEIEELQRQVAEFEPTKRRLRAREMELERLRTTLYKGRAEEFARDASGKTKTLTEARQNKDEPWRSFGYGKAGD